MRVVQSSWGFHECSCTSGIYQICLAWMLNTFSCSCEADALFILDLETSGPNQDVNQDSVPVPTLHHLVQCKSLRNSCKLFFQFGFMLRGGGVGLNCAVVSKRLVSSVIKTQILWEIYAKFCSQMSSIILLGITICVFLDHELVLSLLILPYSRFCYMWELKDIQWY